MTVMVDGRVHEDSSLSRLWKHNLSHDCNAMSARPSRPVVYLQFNGEPIQHYREGSGSTTAGFWVKGNRVYPVDETHISAIMDHPQLFGNAKEVRVVHDHADVGLIDGIDAVALDPEPSRSAA